MSLFKKKETKNNSENETKNNAEKETVSRNTREVEGLEEAFKEEPIVIETPEEPEPVVSLLEEATGVYKSIKINEINFVKSAVPTNEIIVRKKNDKYELIGIGDVEVKIVEGSDQQITLMLLDYMAKKDLVPESKKLGIYKYEASNSEFVKQLTGKTPAELNGVTDEYFASLVLKDNVDTRLRALSTDAIIEAAKLPKDVQKVLGDIVAKVGAKKVTADAVKSLSGVPADENAILMKLLQF